MLLLLYITQLGTRNMATVDKWQIFIKYSSRGNAT